MSKSSKIILVAVVALVGIVVLVAVVAALVLRVNAKPRLEAIASKALGMEVHTLSAQTFPAPYPFTKPATQPVL